ncbi:cupin domain-containing protein [Amycolatopsis lurida]|uniref:cupin domain-containing protein n=1 Tax=Amycolatopsis sp. YIM 10 TaxID=2653857 RepID=UPI001290429A|nr:cupin domain-containing protein [Amycolatopsis sp. YIM 10]QFU93262.1 Cupin domain protein [Amycolatopsis sp. YIM 10]
MNHHLVRATEAETLTGDPGALIELLADTGTTGGALTANRTIFRTGADGAPPHFHTKASELFFVLDGELEVLLGEEVVILKKGDLLVVPPHTPHAFGAVEGKEADVLFVFAPAMGRFDYYRLLDRVHRGETEPKEIGASQERFDNHYVDSPEWRKARSH